MTTSSPAKYFRDAQGKVHPIRQNDSGAPPSAVDRFVTEDTVGKNPKPVTRGGLRDVANSYLKKAGLPPVKDSPLQTLQPQEGRAIAHAYESAKDNPHDPATKASYHAFNKEVGDQWDALTKAGYKMEPWEHPGQPYQTSTDMQKDVDQNHHLYYYKTGGVGNMPNKLMSIDQNNKFRAVHDMFGHAQRGHQFGAIGEVNAYLEHSQMFSPKAQPAMTTETLAQNSTYQYGKYNSVRPANMRQFAGQKATLIPKNLYSGLLARRDAAVSKMSATIEEEPEDYFSCTAHRRGPVLMALGAAVEHFFRDSEGRVHPIGEEHSPEGVTKLAHHSEPALLRELDDSGGFTFHTHSGAQPTEGYAVSPYPDREGTFDSTPTTKELHDYMHNNDDLLSRPDHYLGGWKDNENGGKTYMDVSIIKPTPGEAEDLSNKFHQEAYYDLGKGESVYVHAREAAHSRVISSFIDAMQVYFSDDKPTGYYKDSGGKVHPIMGGFDGQKWHSAGTGKAIDPYRVHPTARATADAETWLKGIGLSKDSIRSNFESMLTGATDKEAEKGKGWYKEGMNAESQKLADSGHMPIHSAAGTIAALSPHNSYDRNLEDAKVAVQAINGEYKGRLKGKSVKNRDSDLKEKPTTHLTITPEQAKELYTNDSMSKMNERKHHPLDAQHYNGMEKEHHGEDFTGTHDVHDIPGDVLAAFMKPRLGGLRGNFARAMVIARGGDPDKVLKGMKVRSFYNNGLHPDDDPYDSSTIDTHIIQAGQGKSRGGYGPGWVEGQKSVETGDSKIAAQVFGSPSKYKLFDDAMKDVSHAHGLRSHQGQATVWEAHLDTGIRGDTTKRDRAKYAAYEDDEDAESHTGGIIDDPDSWTDEEYRQIVKEDNATAARAEAWGRKNDANESH